MKTFRTLMSMLLAACVLMAITISYTETPSGELDGANREFTLTYQPKPGSVRVKKNSVDVSPESFAMSAKTITFQVAPFPGDVLRVSYQYEERLQK